MGIFTPFAQLDSHLGLTLSRKFVELQGGSMMVTSRLGEGSEFTFSIPLEKASSGSLGSYASSQLTPEAAALDGAKARVLVVEDNAVNRLLVSDYPAAHGFKIDVAVDGVEAVSKARAILPDVILMDIQLPRRDGLSATRELKADPATRGIHVVALTALAMKGDASDASKQAATATFRNM